MEAGADHTSGIYPLGDDTDAFTIADEWGMDDPVEILREEDEKRKLAACKNITITEENDALHEADQAGRYGVAMAILYLQPDWLDAWHSNSGSVIYAAASYGRYHLVWE